VDAALDAEMLQEILHRYRAIRRWPEGRGVYDLARQIVLIVIPITTEVVNLARRLLDEYEGLMARDALPAAVARIHGAQAICSYNRDFDEIAGLRRIEPPAFE
jgi:predicted nucleic acid-binding protein